jgi:hypothetical protein
MDPVNQSSTFAGFDRVDKEIAVLRGKLQPVMKNLPSTAKESGSSITALIGRIRSIEDNLADLIDSIEI